MKKSKVLTCILMMLGIIGILILVGCESAVNSSLTKTLNYSPISTTTGTAAEQAAVWTGASPGQTVKYTIVETGSSSAVDGITVDGNGKVTVSDTAASMSATEFTVTATGTGLYGGSLTAKITITIANSIQQIAGTLSYAPISTTTGTAAEQAAVWTGASPEQTVKYTIVETGSSSAVDGITVDGNGKVTVSDSAASMSATEFTVTATGTELYGGSLTAKITITIANSIQQLAGTLSYAPLSTTTGTATEQNAVWTGASPEQTVKYTIVETDSSSAVNGITVDGNGKVMVSDTAAIMSANEFTVTATGTELYGGSLTATILITVVDSQIKGMFSYAPITTSYGVSLTGSEPTWTNANPGQQVTYAIRDPGATEVPGISVAGDGKVSVSESVNVLQSVKFIVTATGAAAYKGSIDGEITITVNPKNLESLSYTFPDVIDVNYPVNIKPDITPIGASAAFEVDAASAPLPAWLTLNSDGSLTGTPTAVMSKSEYTIKAIGKDNYTGSLTSTISIEIQSGYDIANFDLAYTGTSGYVGVPLEIMPVWTGIPAGLSLESSDIEYQLERTDGNTDLLGVDIDTDKGTIILQPTAEQTASTEYSIRVTANGTRIQGTKEAAFTLVRVVSKEYAPPLDTDGDGVYEIYGALGLHTIRENLSWDYELKQDIAIPAQAFECPDPANPAQLKQYDLSSFDPIGNNISEYDNSDAFSGTLNGNDHTISGLVIKNGQGENYVGLFGVVFGSSEEDPAVIKNLIIDHGGIEGEEHVGALAGAVYKYSNIHNAGMQSTSNAVVRGNSNVGGLIGSMYESSVNGYALGDISAAGSKIGGLLGAVYYYCDVEGYALGDVTGSVNVGGLVGLTHWSDTVYGYAAGNVTGDSNVGGLVGFNNGTTRGYATGNVSGDRFVGGLVGGSYGADVDGYARGIVQRKSGSTYLELGKLAGGSADGYHSASESRVLDNTGGIIRDTLLGQDGTEIQDPTKASFDIFTFGNEAGQWTWIEDGKWPAINLTDYQSSNDAHNAGSGQPIQAEQTVYVQDAFEYATLIIATGSEETSMAPVWKVSPPANIIYTLSNYADTDYSVEDDTGIVTVKATVTLGHRELQVYVRDNSTVYVGNLTIQTRHNIQTKLTLTYKAVRYTGYAQVDKATWGNFPVGLTVGDLDNAVYEIEREDGNSDMLGVSIDENTGTIRTEATSTATSTIPYTVTVRADSDSPKIAGTGSFTFHFIRGLSAEEAKKSVPIVDFDGDGVYEVSSPLALDAIRKNMGRDYILTGDIEIPAQPFNAPDPADPAQDKEYDLSNFEPIGDEIYSLNYSGDFGYLVPEALFTGTLDGRNYTISGLHIDRASEENVGLIGVMMGTSTDSAIIKNLSIDHNGIKGGSYVGVLVGLKNSHATLENVRMISSSGAQVTGNDNVAVYTASTGEWDR